MLALRTLIGATICMLALGLAGCGNFLGDSPAKFHDGVLTDRATKMTLYVFDRDGRAPISSACTGQCAVMWPAFRPTVEDAKPSGKFSLFRREDGTMQWAYDGRPLYFYMGDHQPGEKTGDGMNQLWHAVH